MMKKWAPIAAIMVFFHFACEENELGRILSDVPLSEEEVVEGLKSALEVGTDESSDNLHARDGYYKDEIVKIFLPPEADVIIDNITRIPGGQDLLDNTIESVNRAAEDAAIEAKPIFIGAITNMTIADGFAILDGADTAATNYLRVNTYDSLQMAFQPKIQTSLEKPLLLNKSAEQLYGSLINTYNNIPRIPLVFEKPLITENTLSEYTTKRALNGLFIKVADEEKGIRNDPAKRVNDILKRVFGSKR